MRYYFLVINNEHKIFFFNLIHSFSFIPDRFYKNKLQTNGVLLLRILSPVYKLIEIRSIFILLNVQTYP